MSWLLARLYDRMMRESEEACLGSWRADLLGQLTGEVLEIGGGTGYNLPHYSDRVERLVISEPDRHMRQQLEAKLPRAARSFPVELSTATAEELPMADESFDAVVSTLVLCSVEDPMRSLSQIRRVLRPGGRLVFLEHVAAENNPKRLRWQHRVNPLWKRLAGNCHLNRRTAESIEQAGFRLEQVQRESMRKAMPLARPTVRGVAVKP